MVGRRPLHECFGLRTAAGVMTLLMAAFFVSSCAAHRTPVSYPTLAQAERAACGDFGRAEVKRLGESVPAAVAKGFFIGLALDVSWTAQTFGARLPPSSPQLAWDGSPIPTTPPAGAAPLVSWAVGGFQLGRDAAQTNEEVYRDAIDTCMAPARLVAEFGPQDARVATSLELLADCYGWQHRYVLAEPLRREAITIWEAVFRPDDQRVARALDEHARLLRLLHRDQEANSESQRAAMIRTEIYRERERTVTPAEEHPASFSCDSPYGATLFLVCRHAPGSRTAD